jgi:hypothetical protein
MENCQIIAMGVAPKLPIQIPVTNPIDRSLSNPKWSLAKAGVGEKVKLTVQLKKQYENATVEFKIFPEGADTKNSQPIQKIYGSNVGGKSEMEWKFLHDEKKPGKAKYFFTANSFGCAEIKSGFVEQKNPEFTNLQWKKDDKVIEIANIDDMVKLTADCKNAEHVTDVNILVYEKDKDNPDDYVVTIKGKITGGKKLEAEWKVIYVADDDDVNSEQEKRDKGYTLPEFIFLIETIDDKLQSKKGPVLNIQDFIEIYLKDENGEPVPEVKYVVYNMKDEKLAEGNLDSNGYAKVDNVGVHIVHVEFPDWKKDGKLPFLR